MPCRVFHALDVGDSAEPLHSAAAALPAHRRPSASPQGLPYPHPLLHQGAPRPESPAAAPASGRRPSGSLSTASTPRPQTAGQRGPGGSELSGWGRPTRLQAAAGPVTDSLSAFEQRHA